MGNYIFIRIIVEILDYLLLLCSINISSIIVVVIILCEEYFCFHKIFQEHKNIYVYCHCSIVYFYTTCHIDDTCMSQDCFIPLLLECISSFPWCNAHEFTSLFKTYISH
jgi:hypothetical protein